MIEAFEKLKELEGLVTGMQDQLVYIYVMGNGGGCSSLGL
jgi:hypothetical protein